MPEPVHYFTYYNLSSEEARLASRALKSLSPMGLFEGRTRVVGRLIKELDKERGQVGITKKEAAILNRLLEGLGLPLLDKRVRTHLPTVVMVERVEEEEERVLPKAPKVKGVVYQTFLGYDEARRLKRVFKVLSEAAPYPEARRSASRILEDLNLIRDIPYAGGGYQIVFASKLDYDFFMDVLSQEELDFK